MPNRVILTKESVVEQVCEGDQTASSIKELAAETNLNIASLRKQKKPVLVLTDLSGVRAADYGAKKAALAAITDPQGYYDRLAVVSDLPLLKFMAESVIKAAGAVKKVKIFSNREEALIWLKKK